MLNYRYKIKVCTLILLCVVFWCYFSSSIVYTKQILVWNNGQEYSTYLKYSNSVKFKKLASKFQHRSALKHLKKRKS